MRIELFDEGFSLKTLPPSSDGSPPLSGEAFFIQAPLKGELAAARLTEGLSHKPVTSSGRLQLETLPPPGGGPPSLEGRHCHSQSFKNYKTYYCGDCGTLWGYTPTRKTTQFPVKNGCCGAVGLIRTFSYIEKYFSGSEYLKIKSCIYGGKQPHNPTRP